MKGTSSHELEVGLPADEVWAVYGSLALSQLVVKLLPHLIQTVEVIEGDGGVGTVLNVKFTTGFSGPKTLTEKFVRVDNEQRVKDAVAIGGEIMELGFSSYLNRVAVEEKDNQSCIIRSTVEYEIDDEFASGASLVTIGPLAAIADAIAKYLIQNAAASP